MSPRSSSSFAGFASSLLASPSYYTVITQTVTSFLTTTGEIRQTLETTTFTAHIVSATTHKAPSTGRSGEGQTTTESSNASASNNSYPLHPGTTAGIVVGAVAAAFLVTLTGYLILKVRRNSKQRRRQNLNAAPLPSMLEPPKPRPHSIFYKVEKDSNPIEELPAQRALPPELNGEELPSELDSRARSKRRPQRYRTRSKQWTYRFRDERNEWPFTVG